MSTALVHPRSGDRLEVPDGWEVQGDDVEADTVVVIEPDLGQGFRANLVLSVVGNGDLDFAQWQDLSEQGLPRALDGYLLLDRCRAEVAGTPGGRRLAHYTTPDGVPVTMEQWFTALDGSGHTLTATAPDLRYAELSELWSTVAASWQIELGHVG